MIFASTHFDQFRWPSKRNVILTSASILALLVIPRTSCLAHEYPNGFVERSLSIVLRDNVAYGEYSIGLNQATAESFLRKSKVPKFASTTTRSALPGRLATAEIEILAPPNAAGEHLTDLETIQRFAKSPTVWFQNHLNISINSKPVKIKNVQVSPASKHPFSILVKFRFSISSASVDTAKPNKYRLSIKDGIFPSYEGAVRQALKVKGSGMLINSNVAPILVRAQRIEINPVAGPESPLPSQAQQETSTGDEPAADRHHAIGQAETFGTSSPTRAPPVARPPEISATIVFAD